MSNASEEGDLSSTRYRQWARYCVIALYVFCVVWGVIQVMFPDSIRLYMLFSFMFASAATLWARFDAISRSKPILSVLQMIYFFVWPLGALVYLVSRSGWRGFGIGLLNGIGMLLVISLVFYAKFYGLHFAGLLDARYYEASR